MFSKGPGSKEEKGATSPNSNESFSLLRKFINALQTIKNAFLKLWGAISSKLFGRKPEQTTTNQEPVKGQEGSSKQQEPSPESVLAKLIEEANPLIEEAKTYREGENEKYLTPRMKGILINLIGNIELHKENVTAQNITMHIEKIRGYIVELRKENAEAKAEIQNKKEEEARQAALRKEKAKDPAPAEGARGKQLTAQGETSNSTTVILQSSNLPLLDRILAGEIENITSIDKVMNQEIAKIAFAQRDEAEEFLKANAADIPESNRKRLEGMSQTLYHLWSEQNQEQPTVEDTKAFARGAKAFHEIKQNFVKLVSDKKAAAAASTQIPATQDSASATTEVKPIQAPKKEEPAKSEQPGNQSNSSSTASSSQMSDLEKLRATMEEERLKREQFARETEQRREDDRKRRVQEEREHEEAVKNRQALEEQRGAETLKMWQAGLKKSSEQPSSSPAASVPPTSQPATAPEPAQAHSEADPTVALSAAIAKAQPAIDEAEIYLNEENKKYLSSSSGLTSLIRLIRHPDVKDVQKIIEYTTKLQERNKEAKTQIESGKKWEQEQAQKSMGQPSPSSVASVPPPTTVTAPAPVKPTLTLVQVTAELMEKFKIAKTGAIEKSSLPSSYTNSPERVQEYNEIMAEIMNGSTLEKSEKGSVIQKLNLAAIVQLERAFDLLNSMNLSPDQQKTLQGRMNKPIFFLEEERSLYEVEPLGWYRTAISNLYKNIEQILAEPLSSSPSSTKVGPK